MRYYLQDKYRYNSFFMDINHCGRELPPAKKIHQERVILAAGFIVEDPTWNLQTMKTSSLKHYRLSDNYLRFYLRYVKPHRKSIAAGQFDHTSLSNLPGWDAMMGLQFENLVLGNVPALFASLSLKIGDVVRFGPFFQRKTARIKGCQIDLLIQLKYHSFYLCEIKFSPNKIGMSAVHQIDEKLRRIAIPKGWSKRTALIHVNGCTRELQQSGRFDHLIDFSELLVDSASGHSSNHRVGSAPACRGRDTGA